MPAPNTNSQGETETIDNAVIGNGVDDDVIDSGSAGTSIVPNLALAAVWALCAIAVNV